MPPTAQTPSLLTGYGRLWKSVPRELAFLVLAFPIALAGFVLTVSLFTTGIGSLTIFVGVFVVIAALFVARGFGALEITRLAWAGRPPIPRPV
jgi:hypothetical protein